MMCSKKWANPVFPGSTTFRDPACTGIWIETMLGNPVGTTMTFRPLGSVVSDALKGRTSDVRLFAAVSAGFGFVGPGPGNWAKSDEESSTDAVRTAATGRTTLSIGR